jgi:hypothetical protein
VRASGNLFDQAHRLGAVGGVLYAPPSMEVDDSTRLAVVEQRVYDLTEAISQFFDAIDHVAPEHVREIVSRARRRVHN